MLTDGPGDGNDISMSDWMPGSFSNKSGFRSLVSETLVSDLFELVFVTVVFDELLELASSFKRGSFWLLLFELFDCVGLFLSVLLYFIICVRAVSWGGFCNLIKSKQLSLVTTSYECGVPGWRGRKRCTTTCFNGRLLRAFIHLVCLLRECYRNKRK